MISEVCLTILVIGIIIKAVKRPRKFPPGKNNFSTILSKEFKQNSTGPRRIASAWIFAFSFVMGSPIYTQGHEENE